MCVCVCVVINRDGAHPGGLFVSGSVTDGASLFTRRGGGGMTRLESANR